MIRKYGKLREAIRLKYSNYAEFADAMNMHQSTISKKLSGRADWTSREIEQVCELLQIPVELISEYFFY